MYWLPQLVRDDLEKEFKSIQDEFLFWKFVENHFANYVFRKNSLIDENGRVKMDLLTEY